MSARRPTSEPRAAQGIDRLLGNVRHGRFERSLSGLTAVGALITGVEIWLEHDRASFGNKMMWLPVALTPVVSAAGLAGVVSKRAAKTALPAASALVLVNSLQGQYLHLRGVAQRPGGFSRARYNMEMGPPTFAPLLFGLVGAMGLLASVLAPGALNGPVGSSGRRAAHPGIGRGPIPGIRRDGPSVDLGSGDDRRGDRPARPLRDRCASSARPTRRRPGHCSTGCWPRTTSRGCRCSR